MAPLIHIGYHKTGTTWLQKFLFNNAAAGFITPFDKSTELMEWIVMPHPFDFDVDACRAHMESEIESALAGNVIPVITSERFVGSPHGGGFDSKELADRLHALWPEARVLVVIREQKDMLLSTYKQYVKGGGCGSPEDFMLPPRRKTSKKMALFTFEHFEYHRLIDYYYKLFGKEKVLVVTYEMFTRTPQPFVDAITEFAGARTVTDLPFKEGVNVGQSPYLALARSRWNFVAARTQLNPVVPVRSNRVREGLDNLLKRIDQRVPDSRQKSINAAFKEQTARLAGERFRHSNRITSEMIGVDLSTYGYDV